MFGHFHQIEIAARELAKIVPLELFVLVGAFIEEVVAFIPSMLIMTTAGFFAHIEGRTIVFLIWLVLLGNVGKLAGSWIYYTLGDKLEDFIVGKCGRFLGLSHTDIERVGKRMTGNPWSDGAVLFFLRVIPFFPTVLVSIASGVIKLPLRTFLIASYLGNFCKDLFYAFAGYYGARTLRAFFMDIERVRFGIGTLSIALLIGTIIVFYVNRHQGARFYTYMCDRLRKKK